MNNDIASIDPTQDFDNAMLPGRGRRRGVRHPSDRARIVEQFSRGCDARMTRILRLGLTPSPLLDLPDHSIRGKKSLGRIQQLTNRKLYKRRVA